VILPTSEISSHFPDLLSTSQTHNTQDELQDEEAGPAVVKGVLTGVMGGEAAEAHDAYGESGVVTDPPQLKQEWSTGLLDCCDVPASRYLYVRFALACVLAPLLTNRVPV